MCPALTTALRMSLQGQWRSINPSLPKVGLVWLLQLAENRGQNYLAVHRPHRGMSLVCLESWALMAAGPLCACCRSSLSTGRPTIRWPAACIARRSPSVRFVPRVFYRHDCLSGQIIRRSRQSFADPFGLLNAWRKGDQLETGLRLRRQRDNTT
jgi:hypothetical protein